MEEIKELTQDKLDEITKNGHTVLEFSAAWCPDCRFLDPFMPQIEKDFPNDKFYKISSIWTIIIKISIRVFVPSVFCSTGGIIKIAGISVQ